MKTESELQQQKDKEFSKTLAQTLDKSVANIDDLTAQRLKNARAKALAYKAPSTHSKPKWVNYGVAASLMMLIAIPVAWQQHSAQQFSDADAEYISQEVPLAAQELDDIDMLMALDDADA